MGKVRFLSSLVTRISLTIISVVAIFLLLMNTYFLTASRDMMFASKKIALQNQASIVGISLSALDNLTSESVSQVLSLLDLKDLARVEVVDAGGNVVYAVQYRSSSMTEALTAEYLSRALEGNDVFYASFSDNAFLSSVFMPITDRGSVEGAVFINESDTDQGEILKGLQNSIQRISIIMTLFSTVIIFFVLSPIMRRIRTILKAIVSVREGEYAFRIVANGNDELTQLCDEFNRLASRLQETEERRRRFVADASHELKTPLASIRLLSDSILQNENMSRDMVREFISDIGDEASRLARTTEKLLALTRLDNKVINERESVDMLKVIHTTLKMLRPLAESRSVHVFLDLCSHCTILASEDEIRQIVLNLIENAIKYNTYNGNVYISLRESEEEIMFAVEDTGIGIPDEDIPYIFDRFYRVDKARSREAGGSGLGLAIVRNTVKDLGGEITLDHRQEGGMRFKVVLPRSAPGAALEQAGNKF